MRKSNVEQSAIEALDAPLKFAGRLMMAAIFVVSGYAKILGYADTAQYMQSAGLPAGLLPLAILVELGGSILIVLGWKTVWAALALSVFSLLAAYFFHLYPSDENQMIHFMKDIAIAGGFLILAAAGPGAWSLDRGIATKYAKAAGVRLE